METKSCWYFQSIDVVVTSQGVAQSLKVGRMSLTVWRRPHLVVGQFIYISPSLISTVTTRKVASGRQWPKGCGVLFARSFFSPSPPTFIFLIADWLVGCCCSYVIWRYISFSPTVCASLLIDLTVCCCFSFLEFQSGGGRSSRSTWSIQNSDKW